MNPADIRARLCNAEALLRRYAQAGDNHASSALADVTAILNSVTRGLPEASASEDAHAAPDPSPLYLLLDFAPDSYLLTDELGVIVEANRATADLLCAPAPSLRGKPLASYVPDGDRRAFRDRVNRLANIAEPLEWEMLFYPRPAPLPIPVRAFAHACSDDRCTIIRWMFHTLVNPRPNHPSEIDTQRRQWEHIAERCLSLVAEVDRLREELSFYRTDASGAPPRPSQTFEPPRSPST